jgi:hypothetical protein
VDINTLPLSTMDGLTLEADLVLPDQILGAAVICHPHPQYGGDRFNNVVDALFRAFAGAGLATVRFDFRGVNNSEGRHGGGVDERMDALAAIEAVEAYAGDGPLLLAGYSFGAFVALDVAVPRIDGWLAVAPALGMTRSTPVAATDARPKLVLVPAHDQFSPPAATAAATAGWPGLTVETIEMADHFLGGRTTVVAERAVAFVSALAAR